MSDLAALADKIDPRNWPRVGYPMPDMPNHYAVARADLIAASDALRTLSRTTEAVRAMALEEAAKVVESVTGDGVPRPAPGHCARGWRITSDNCPKCGASSGQNCPGDIFDHVTIAAHIRALRSPMTPEARQAMVEKVARALEEYCRNPVMLKCQKCNGTGYHHGFGEDGCDPDWCTECGGSQYIEDKLGHARAVLTSLGIPAQTEGE